MGDIFTYWTFGIDALEKPRIRRSTVRVQKYGAAGLVTDWQKYDTEISVGMSG